MSAAKHSILVEQGSIFEMELTITDETNQRVDLTGFDFVGKIRKDSEDAVPIASFQFDLLDQNSSETKGQVRAFLPTSTTSAIPIPGGGDGRRNIAEYLYDIKYGPTGGEMKRLLEGSALISPEASK